MLLNLILMLAWAGLNGDFRPANLIVGFGLGYVVLSLLASSGVVGSMRYVTRSRLSIRFLLFYFAEIIKANVGMAMDVCRPRLTMRPAFVAVPLDELTDSDVEITLLAHLVTLTPGTLSIDVSPDRRTLYVYAMNIPNGDLDAFRTNLKHDLERRVIEVLR